MSVDSIADLSGCPTVVSVSDVHGYRDRFESALSTPAYHPDFDPVVEREDGDLRWCGGDDYVLVVNGDLVNRGPDSAGCVDLVRRLREQAPDGHVRRLLGNHDLVIPYPSPPGWDWFWANGVDDDRRRRFWERTLDGDVTVAFAGHRYTYTHAGSPDGVDQVAVNERFRDLARRLVDSVGTVGESEDFERAVAETTPELVWPDLDEVSEMRENPDAGVVWLDWSFLRVDSPPQVVGHTTQDEVARRGNVVCQDTILPNADSPGGETLLVETPEGLQALVRTPDGGVDCRRM